MEMIPSRYKNQSNQRLKLCLFRELSLLARSGKLDSFERHPLPLAQLLLSQRATVEHTYIHKPLMYLYSWL